jgi:hypothetical protein
MKVALEQLLDRFSQLRRSYDLAGIRRLLSDHPEMLADLECSSEMLIGAAKYCDSPEVIALLLDLGINPNLGSKESAGKRAIGYAALYERWDIVRLLVERGAEVNYWTYGRCEPWSVPLSTAISKGRLEMVRYLVEHGAKLDVCNPNNITPLADALQKLQLEIADYLREKGAILPHQARNWRTPVHEHLVREMMEAKALPWQPDSSDSPVQIRYVSNIGFMSLVTEGMSARPMRVPEGKEYLRFAELVLPLGEYWPWHDGDNPLPPQPTAPKAWQEDRYVWIIDWLIRLTRYPFENGTWLGDDLFSDANCIISNGSPPQPLSPYTQMTCWLPLFEGGGGLFSRHGDFSEPYFSDKERLDTMWRLDGTGVDFYCVIPIHTAERDFARKHGLKALLKRFREHNVPAHIDPKRKSVVKGPR